jgi:hypothetical protein
MSQLKYCQGPKCHEHKTRDRIRGPKGDKHYETRKRTYYHDEFCDQRCMNDWMRMHGTRAIDHFGRLHEPKRADANSAWYKDYKYNYNNGTDRNYNHFFVNDLLGQRIPITEQQYDDKQLTNPNGSLGN